MSDLHEFEKQIAGKTGTSQALLESLRETFVLGVGEFSKSISHMFVSSKRGSSKHQIDSELSSWEKSIAESRYDM